MDCVVCTEQYGHSSKPSPGMIGLLLAEDIGVTGIQNGHDGAAEELTAGSAKFNLYKY